MNSVGYHKCKACKHPFISEPSRQKRLDFALKHEHFTGLEWSNWVFSDEVAFRTETQATKWVIRTSGERQHRDCTQNQY